MLSIMLFSIFVISYNGSSNSDSSKAMNLISLKFEELSAPTLEEDTQMRYLRK